MLAACVLLSFQSTLPNGRCKLEEEEKKIIKSILYITLKCDLYKWKLILPGKILGCMHDRVTLWEKFLQVCFCFSCCKYFKIFFKLLWGWKYWIRPRVWALQNISVEKVQTVDTPCECTEVLSVHSKLALRNETNTNSLIWKTKVWTTEEKTVIILQEQ